jgi:hypothetical protein
MEAVILFLLKTIGSGVIGYYVKKALEKMDPELARMFASGSSTKEIEAYIETKKELKHNVEQLAENVVGESIILPLASEHAPTLEARAIFFTRIVETGFLLSHSWKADLLIKGSFFGPHGFMSFHVPSKPPVVKRVGVEVTVESEFGCAGLAVIPFSEDSFPKERWDGFKEALRNAKGDTNDYVTFSSLGSEFSSLENNCNVSEFSAAAIRFEHALMLRARRPELKSMVDPGGKAVIGDWQSGLDSFVQSITELRELFVLPITDRDAIESLTSRLSSVLEKKA